MLKCFNCTYWNKSQILKTPKELERSLVKLFIFSWLNYVYTSSFYYVFCFSCADAKEIVLILEIVTRDEFYSLSVIKNAFSNNRRFSRPRCKQMETDLDNPPYEFFSKRTHLVVLTRILPKRNGFWAISGVFWARFL